MCLGSIDVLDEAWEDGGARTGRPTHLGPATGPRTGV